MGHSSQDIALLPCRSREEEWIEATRAVAFEPMAAMLKEGAPSARSPLEYHSVSRLALDSD